jgi:hypothetical protein
MVDPMAEMLASKQAAQWAQSSVEMSAGQSESPSVGCSELRLAVLAAVQMGATSDALQAVWRDDWMAGSSVQRTVA